MNKKMEKYKYERRDMKCKKDKINCKINYYYET